MTIGKAIQHLENMKWLKGYSNTAVDGVPLDSVIDGIVALLKAQEPKPVHVTAEISHRKIGECPNCGKPINSGDYPNYCGHCGRAVRWDA